MFIRHRYQQKRTLRSLKLLFITIFLGSYVINAALFILQWLRHIDLVLNFGATKCVFFIIRLLLILTTTS